MPPASSQHAGMAQRLLSVRTLAQTLVLVGACLLSVSYLPAAAARPELLQSAPADHEENIISSGRFQFAAEVNGFIRAAARRLQQEESTGYGASSADSGGDWVAPTGGSGDLQSESLSARDTIDRDAAALQQGASSAGSSASASGGGVGEISEPTVRARWLDCQESWWRQCVVEGRIVQPVVVQKIAKAMAGLWTAGLPDPVGDSASSQPLLDLNGYGGGRDRECQEMKAAARGGLGDDSGSTTSVCHPLRIHVIIPLDEFTLRGALATINSVISNARCPNRLLFHVPSMDASNRARLATSMQDTFDNVHVYHFNQGDLAKQISPVLKPELEGLVSFLQYFPDRYLPHCVEKVVYLESDVIVQGDIEELWNSPSLEEHVAAATQFCARKVDHHFTHAFWTNPELSGGVRHVRESCIFDGGVMLMNLSAWREGNLTQQMEHWMDLHQAAAIYDPSHKALPAALLVLSDHIRRLAPEWNFHGLGEHCRQESLEELQAARALHWSGDAKPWQRAGTPQACTVDSLWERYDAVGSGVSSGLVA